MQAKTIYRTVPSSSTQKVLLTKLLLSALLRITFYLPTTSTAAAATTTTATTTTTTTTIATTTPNSSLLSTELTTTVASNTSLLHPSSSISANSSNEAPSSNRSTSNYTNAYDVTGDSGGNGNLLAPGIPVENTTSREGGGTSTAEPSGNSSVTCQQLIKHDGTSPPHPPTTPKPNCLPGFECEHGECTAGMSCECEPGWAGIFCQHPCPIDCEPDGTCMTGPGGEPTCACDVTATYVPGSGCVNTTDLNLTTTTEAPRTTPADLRPLAERECFPGFTCMHGYCQHGSLTCACERGWRGAFCEQPCSLDCGGHGWCREDQNYALYCTCDVGYTGDNCELSSQINQNDNNTTTTTAPETTTAPTTRTTAPTTTTAPTSTTTAPTSTTTAPTSVQNSTDSDFGSWGQPGGGDTSDVTTQRPDTTSEVRSTSVVVPYTTASDTTTATTTTTTTTVAATNTTTMASLSTVVATQATLRPLEERMCMPGFICEHGYCVKADLECVCDQGWDGAFCRVQKVADDTFPTAATTTTVTSNDTMVEEWERLEGFPPLVPLPLRHCINGFVCRYGNCTEDGDRGYVCKCEYGFIGPFCEELCPLTCGPNSYCAVSNPSRNVSCVCDLDFIGPNCTHKSALSGVDPDLLTRSDMWVGVGVTTAVLLLVTVTVSVTAYLLWRRRNVTMMKIVFWFRDFEEDDGREYDAFVSYASTDWDRHFVIQTLMPRLEGRLCFSLCIHQRNFEPGLYITENITESVKRSRRTLLVITPAFISSTWCRFEYQVALKEMLDEKHRILPIVIGDVTEHKKKMDETLKTILGTVTWLEYPGHDASQRDLDKFWKRLALSMPKKRPAQSEDPSSPTSSTSQNSNDGSIGQLVTSKPPSPTTTAGEIADNDPKISPGPIIKVPFPSENGKDVEYKQIVRVPASELKDNVQPGRSLCPFSTGWFRKAPPKDKISRTKQMKPPLSGNSKKQDQLQSFTHFGFESEVDGGCGVSRYAVQKGLSDQNGVSSSANDGQRLRQAPIHREQEALFALTDNFLGDQSIHRQLAT